MSSFVTHYYRLTIIPGHERIEADKIPFCTDNVPVPLTRATALTQVNQWNSRATGRFQYWID